MTNRSNAASPRTLRGRCVALAALLVALTVGAAPARQATGDDSAAAFVEALYRFHFAHEQDWGATRKRYASHLSPHLTRLLAADDRLKAAADGNLIGLDFDPVSYTQEELVGYRVGETARRGASTIVAVDLWYEGSGPGKHEHDVRVRVARGRSGWTIEDFEYGDSSLVQSLEGEQ